MFNTITDQVAQVLRDGLNSGRWQGTMPGRNYLATELGVNHKTTQAALAILEQEGLLKANGPGRKRLIQHVMPVAPVAKRFMILAYEKSDFHTDYMVEIIHRLQAAGHWASFASKTLDDLGMNVNRVASFVEKTKADAWVVGAGHRDVLDWFAARPQPVFSLFAHDSEQSIARAVPDKSEALIELVDRLVGLGHRRIVMIAREDRRKPNPSKIIQSYLTRLAHHGVHTGSYNLPDWGNHPEELRQSLSLLFRYTPPTALILDDVQMFPAVVHHLAELGISAPREVSLACMDYAISFDWFCPPVTHVTWNHIALVKRLVSWANQISLGKEDRGLTKIKAKLNLGGTIGLAPKISTH